MSLTVRAYNVLFGDCILLSWDEDDRPHHAWVDFGNMPGDPNLVFDTVYEDVLARTGGHLDLVLVTHRHLDHLEGFHACGQRFARDFQVIASGTPTSPPPLTRCSGSPTPRWSRSCPGPP